MSLNNPANINFGPNDPKPAQQPQQQMSFTKEAQPERREDDFNPDEERPNAELRALFYRDDANERVGVNFSVADYDNEIPEEESINLTNQLIAVADNTWLGVLTEGGDHEIVEAILEDKLHAIYHAFPEQEDGDTFLDTVTKMTDRLRKAHA